jgi:hypothetical protein
MEKKRAPNFLVLADTPREDHDLILNLDLVRAIEVDNKAIRFIFSESHRVRLTGPAANEALKKLAVACEGEGAIPSPEAIKRFKNRTSKSEVRDPEA